MAQERFNAATIVLYNLSGQTEFVVPFEYLARKFVTLTLRGSTKKTLVMGVDYRFVNPTTVSLNITPAAEFNQLEVRRHTSATERLVSFQDGSILRAGELNIATMQSIHVAEEARDLTLYSIGLNEDGNLDAHGRRIVRVADGVLPTDAVTVGQVENIASSGGVNTLREQLASPTGGSIIGFKSRDVASKLADVLSVKDFGAIGDGVTNDQAAIVAALEAAVAGSATLYWPEGVYVTSANLDNIHKVQHSGHARLSRSGSVFIINPRGAEQNVLYVGGADVVDTKNDGLSVATGMRNLHEAFDALVNHGPTLEGNWAVRMSAGTFNLAASSAYLSGITSVNRVVIEGAAPTADGTPTTIVDGGDVSAPYQHGIAAVGVGLKVTIKNIKAIRFSGDGGNGTRGAFLADEGADLFTDNVYAYGSSWFGVYASRGSSLRLKGGHIDRCRNGVVSDMAKMSVGYGSSSIIDGPRITNSTEAGVYWTRESDGHTDYVNFEGNAVAMVVSANSRTDAVGCNFKGNTVAVRTNTGGIFGDNPYTPCTFEGNTTDLDVKAFSGRGSELEKSLSEVVIAVKRTTNSVTGATAASFPLATVPAGRVKGTGKAIRVTMFGAFTEAPAGTQLIVNVGGLRVPLTVVGASTNETFRLDVEMQELGGGWRGSGSLTHGLNKERIGGSSGSLDVNASVPIYIDVVTNAASAAITLYGAKVYMMG